MKINQIISTSFLWALNDIVQRYRRSILGPAWITLSNLIFILSISFIYSSFFNANFFDYLIWVTTGLLPWYLILIQIEDGMSAFTESESIIKSMKINNLIFILRVTFRNYLIFFHNIAILIVLYLFYENIIVSFYLIFVPIILLIYFSVLFPLGGIFAIIATRFRDIQSLTKSILQIIFFLSPIIWMPSFVPDSKIFIIDYNPVFHFIDLFRGIVLNQELNFHSLIIILSFALVFNLIFFFLYKLNYKKIVFWL
jgi:ABC-type polysaccharide/polyol phosphate export permease